MKYDGKMTQEMRDKIYAFQYDIYQLERHEYIRTMTRLRTEDKKKVLSDGRVAYLPIVLVGLSGYIQRYNGEK